jgi:hypothetical protein
MSSDSHSSFGFRPLLALLAPLTLLLTGCVGPDLIDRITRPRWGFCGTVVIVLDFVALFDLLGDGARGTTNKVLWSLLIIFFPVGGVVLYFLLGRE